MPDVFEPPHEETTGGVASRRWGGNDQPTRAEAKVGLAVAAALLVLYAMWIWQPFRADGCPQGSAPDTWENKDCTRVVNPDGPTSSLPPFIDENGQFVDP